MRCSTLVWLRSSGPALGGLELIQGHAEFAALHSGAVKRWVWPWLCCLVSRLAASTQPPSPDPLKLDLRQQASSPGISPPTLPASALAGRGCRPAQRFRYDSGTL